MNAALCVGACLCFFAGFPIPALVLRCGLSACMRFSPRAALGLSGLAALFACAFSLCVRVVKGERFAFSPMLPAAAFWGGAFGRACVLIMDASLPSSVSLLRVQSPVLAALMLFAMLVRLRKTDAAPRGIYFAAAFSARTTGASAGAHSSGSSAESSIQRSSSCSCAEKSDKKVQK